MNETVSNIDLRTLLEHSDEIVSDPALWNTMWADAGLGLAHLGFKAIPVGLLLEQWRDGKMVSSCRGCGERVLIYFASGSPLSGINQWKGRCVGCNQEEFGRWDNFGTVLQAVLPKLENKPALKIEPYSIAQLLAKLRTKSANVL